MRLRMTLGRHSTTLRNVEPSYNCSGLFALFVCGKNMSGFGCFGLLGRASISADAVLAMVDCTLSRLRSEEDWRSAIVVVAAIVCDEMRARHFGG